MCYRRFYGRRKSDIFRDKTLITCDVIFLPAEKSFNAPHAVLVRYPKGTFNTDIFARFDLKFGLLRKEKRKVRGIYQITPDGDRDYFERFLVVGTPRMLLQFFTVLMIFQGEETALTLPAGDDGFYFVVSADAETYLILRTMLHE